jgi:hypothetical protein
LAKPVHPRFARYLLRPGCPPISEVRSGARSWHLMGGHSI